MITYCLRSIPLMLFSHGGPFYQSCIVLSSLWKTSKFWKCQIYNRKSVSQGAATNNNFLTDLSANYFSGLDDQILKNARHNFPESQVKSSNRPLCQNTSLKSQRLFIYCHEWQRKGANCNCWRTAFKHHFTCFTPIFTWSESGILK